MAEAMTMMRLGEMHCFDEEQRIAIMEMVKDGSMTVAEAQAEVKRTRPVTFGKVKYFGAVPSAAPTMKRTLTAQQGAAAVTLALQHIKKAKVQPRTVTLTASTVGMRVTNAGNGDTLENEPMIQISHAEVTPSDKKRVAWVTSYSQLGLLYCHVVQLPSTKLATEFFEELESRRSDARILKSQVPATGIDKMAAPNVDDDDDDGDDDGGQPLGVFLLTYLGNVPVSVAEGDEVIGQCLEQLSGPLQKVLRGSKKEKKEKDAEASSDENDPVQVALVVSSEGIRTVEVTTKDMVHNVIIKAISYSTEVVGKKIELFAFIEVDDRRDTKTCHAFVVEKWAKGQASAICHCIAEAFEIAVQEAKARAGNPLLPVGRERDRVEGPLKEYQMSRKDLQAIKAIGAGQFGKVYLANSASQETQYAVKMLRKGASQQDRTEFLREAETMLNLGNHDNVVNFVGVCVKQRPWLVVLGFCQYGDLSDVLTALRKKKNPLTIQEQLKFAKQLALGMQYIHSKGYVHMDLAARNCLIDGQSNIKVADFGLTHPYDEGKRTYRQYGVLKLSIRWLAIDAFDTKVFSEKTDVWSYGVTLWEIMTHGLQPYAGHGLQEVLRLVRGGARLPKPPPCPDQLFGLMSACWNPKREARPSFAQISKKVDTYIENLPGAAPRDIGVVLASQISARLNRLSKRVKKKPSAAQAAVPPPVEEEGLVGVISQDSSASLSTSSIPAPAAIDK
eukprot:m.216844 g.216844  ORF g.216844 m.216844 type:complete len:729 (+) comp18661_c3_seq2:315-2501(+)